MFTGIVDGKGELKEIVNSASGMSALIAAPYNAAGMNIGASIACDGVCLTVTERHSADAGSTFRVDISPETLKVTNLKNWHKGQVINLERAMRMGDEIGGHIVSGHVDGLCKIVKIEPLGDNRSITFLAPSGLAKFIATKGSVCLNGTSLTVNDAKLEQFSVNLIPHTLEVTGWGKAVLDQEVNLEIDMLARYVSRLREFDPR